MTKARSASSDGLNGGVVLCRPAIRYGHLAVALLVTNRAARCIDRQVLMVGTHSIKLRVVITKQPTLQHLVG